MWNIKSEEIGKLVRSVDYSDMGIKASGGVASIEDGVGFMRSGATVVAFRRHLIDQLEKIGWKKP